MQPDQLLAEFVDLFEQSLYSPSFLYPLLHFFHKLDRNVHRLRLPSELRSQQVGRVASGRIVRAPAVLPPAFPGNLGQGPRNGDGTLAQLLRPGPDSLFQDVFGDVFHHGIYIYLSDNVKRIPARKMENFGLFSGQGEVKAKINTKNSLVLRR
jgi:hypothetical protein